MFWRVLEPARLARKDAAPLSAALRLTAGSGRSMKFGKYLESRVNPDWADQYIDYKALKDLIKKASEQAAAVGHNVAFSPRTTSLTVQRGQSLNRNNAELDFFNTLDSEVRKVDEFTKQKVADLKKAVKSLQDQARNIKKNDNTQELIEEAKQIGDSFLALEKYVNLNYLGFHKILKKHDKQLPETPCQSYYVQHLHGQSWVQGNHSDLLVQLSHIHSILRGDITGVKNEDSSQGFVRSTTKYWVTTDDVSHVKHSILQHLPVFQYNEGGDDASDSQLINSVYLDNSSLELYHGRLDKRPNALALRIRWYGDERVPGTCFMERKTHRESWKGEESVKDRFTLSEARMLPFLVSEFTVDQAKAELQKKGKPAGEVEKFGAMFSEVQRVVDSKQLHPMIRTQYMRTAFQIPFDATVRVSLDTNLTMIKENPDSGPSCAEAGRWFRDPTLPVPRSEYTRFPHAVLEVKLSLPEGQSAPQWVTSLIESGMLTEVHKFSKFIHGTSVLLPDMVQAVPYWIDDESIRKSIIQSSKEGASSSSQPAAKQAPLAAAAKGKPRRRTQDGDDLTHPLLGDSPTLQLIQPRDGASGGKEGGGRKGGWLDWYFQSRKPPPQAMARTTPMRIEPKTFFANERTFLSWLHMAITIGSISAALLGFAGQATKTKEKTRATDDLVEIIAMILLPVAILMCGYALLVFVWRAQAIAKEQVGFIDDRFGPLGLALVVILALLAIFIVSIVDFAIDMFH